MEATLIASLSTFVADVKSGHFLFLNVAFVFVWLTCLVIYIGVPPLSHFGAPVLFWCCNDRVCVLFLFCLIFAPQCLSW